MRKTDQQLADEIEARLEELGRQVWPPVTSKAENASGRLEAAIRRLVRRSASRHRAQETSSDLETMTAPAFRAVVAQRLRTLEHEIGDVRTRINGLIFVALGGALAQLIERIFN